MRTGFKKNSVSVSVSNIEPGSGRPDEIRRNNCKIDVDTLEIFDSLDSSV
jgi:hypothetical protein